jgi:hypothetical protein
MQWMMQQWCLFSMANNNSFGNNEFGWSRREGKNSIQVRCKTHTLNEYISIAMYPLNT